MPFLDTAVLPGFNNQIFLKDRFQQQTILSHLMTCAAI